MLKESFDCDSFGSVLAARIGEFQSRMKDHAGYFNQHLIAEKHGYIGVLAGGERLATIATTTMEVARDHLSRFQSEQFAGLVPEAAESVGANGADLKSLEKRSNAFVEEIKAATNDNDAASLVEKADRAKVRWDALRNQLTLLRGYI